MSSAEHQMSKRVGFLIEMGLRDLCGLTACLDQSAVKLHFYYRDKVSPEGFKESFRGFWMVLFIL
jgi:hypothetical protein